MFPSSYVEVVSRLDMSMLGLCMAALLTIYVTRWLYRWRNPKCNGVLPPGSMGLPFIGETLALIVPSFDFDLLPFIRARIQRYGPIFSTNIAGRRVVVSTDREFNYFLLKQDEKLVESWSFDTFADVFDQKNFSAQRRKYTRNLTLNHFGVAALQHKLLPCLEDMISKTLGAWSRQESVEVKSATISVTIDFVVKQLCGSDLEKAPFNFGDMYKKIIAGLLSFPLNVPGTTHHKTLKIRKQVMGLMSDVLKRRRLSSEIHEEDLLDHLIKDQNTERFLSDDYIIQFMFSLLYVTSDSISTTCALALKLISEYPDVLKELNAEHEEILKKRTNIVDSLLTWNEYKSMTFTHQVINEVLRLGNTAPGLFRRALKDISINGYTIPAGWGILIASTVHHLDSTQFEDPLSFNPKRWQELKSDILAKSFMPFGSGMKQCPGADYCRVFLSIFLHIMVTKYSWKLVKGGKITRAPIIRFPEGFHFKITAKA